MSLRQLARTLLKLASSVRALLKPYGDTLLLFPVDRDTQSNVLMPRVCFKPITWYIELHHVRTFFSVWRYGFFVLRDVHSQHVYLQEESLPPFLSCRMHLKNRSEFVLIIFYLQLINSGHADSSMADKKHGKLSSRR